MTAKALFVLAAALCALAAATASPLIRLDKDVKEVPEWGLDLQFNDLDLQSLEELKWINSTAILEKIEEILGTVEDKINEVSTEVESAVEAILEGIENSALEVAANWNATVNEWVDKAAQAGVDVQECIDSQKSLQEVAVELAASARQCVNKSLTDVSDALANLKAVGPEARALLKAANDQIVVCTSEPNPVSTGICLITTLPPLQIKAAGLLSRAVWRAGLVAAKAAAMGPLASLCSSKATAGCAAEATAIVKETVGCIKEKLGQ